MSELERQRLQDLVDAIHHTAAALQGAARSSARGGSFAPGGGWRPIAVPSGWPPLQLGTETEAAMFVPYVTAVPPYFPLTHTAYAPMGYGPTPYAPAGYGPVGYPQTPFGPTGLSHTGINPLQGGSFGWINPLQMQQGIPGGYGYGYRPVGHPPYGYGLSHAGIGYEGGYGSPMSYGYLPQMGHGYTTPMHGGGMPMQSPLQPNWSPITGPQTQG